MQSQNRNAELEDQNQALNDKLQSPFRNPFVMAAIGILLGVAVVQFNHK